MADFFNFYILKGIILEIFVVALAVLAGTALTFILNVFQAYETSLVLIIRLGLFIFLNLIFGNSVIIFFAQGINASLG